MKSHKSERDVHSGSVHADAPAIPRHVAVHNLSLFKVRGSISDHDLSLTLIKPPLEMAHFTYMYFMWNLW